MTSGVVQSGRDLRRGPWHRGLEAQASQAFPSPPPPSCSRPGFPTLGPLTEPKDPIQGYVLSNIKQGRHGQLLGQIQSGPEIEAVTWGTGGHLVSSSRLRRGLGRSQPGSRG